MFDSYIHALNNHLDQKSNPKTKKWWEHYVKDGAPFMGVKMAEIRSFIHDWHEKVLHHELDDNQQVELALHLIFCTYTEQKLAGTLLLHERYLPAGLISCPDDIERLETLFAPGGIYDWNICDWFCVKVLASLIEKDGKRCAENISAWRHADFLWKARASLVPFVKHADNRAYYPLIEETCNVLIRRDERFAKTAVGWILREISNHDEDFTRRLIENQIRFFSTESLNNATKYFESEEQKSFKQMLDDA